jgi:hypothetical protein
MVKETAALADTESGGASEDEGRSGQETPTASCLAGISKSLVGQRPALLLDGRQDISDRHDSDRGRAVFLQDRQIDRRRHSVDQVPSDRCQRRAPPGPEKPRGLPHTGHDAGLFEGEAEDLDNLIDTFRTNALEDYDAGIEASFLPLLERALNRDISFYSDEQSRITLFHFLA